MIIVEDAGQAEQSLRSLTLLLNLEYLQAEFYARAVDGVGLSADERGVGAGPVVGGRRVAFVNPIVAAFVKGAAQDERHHIRILREMFAELDAEPFPAPKIDLDASFTAALRAAGIVRQDQAFDAFANDTNLLLAAYMFEDVVQTAYQGALATMVRAFASAHLAAVAAAEAGHSAVVRMLLLTAGLSNETNAVSVLRQRLSGLMGTHFQGSDHGVGTLDDPTVLAVDGRSIGWGRTTAQCLNVVYGNTEGKAGGFFPEGIAERIADTARYTPVYFGTLTSLTPEDPMARELRAFPAERVELHPVRWDASKLELFATRDEIAPNTQDHYGSTSPRVVEIDNALIVGAVGIVAVRDFVVHETMWHTDPRRHHYSRVDDAVVLRPPMVEPLPGTTISILTGAAESYWHSLVDAALRLILIDDDMWRRATRLLLPSTGVRQNDLAELFGIPAWVEVRSVLPHESFRAETLILPSSLHGVFDFHASLTNAFFDRLLARAVPPSPAPARRIFIDRRGSNLRRLVCEDELIAALPGFEPVKLETLPSAEQARVFADADIIVAPHGAGLTNIGFARPGTVVVELMMDTYRNWCFRRLAAARGLTYFCVLGRSLDPQKAAQSVHLQSWSIDIGDVQAAVAQAELLVAEQGARV